jgi:hypothetical protein
MGPYRDHVAVTPNDTTALPDGTCSAIMCTGAGNAVVVLESGRTVTLALLAGFAAKQEYLIRQVKSTSTTATGIVALYL